MKTRAAPGSLELLDVVQPEPRDGHLIVRVRAVALCGTDLHIYDWDRWAATNYSPPFVPGHELCGEVLWAPPGESDIRVGDLVTVETHIACGRCYQCAKGEGHVCANLKLYSRSGYSPMAEMTLVPVSAARRVPSGIGSEVGAVMEPLGVAVHALEVGRPEDALVAVMGCGPVGLFAVTIARSMGARRVLAVDPVPFRRRLAQELGANVVIDPSELPASQAILELTSGTGVDVLVEASGKPDGVSEGLLALRGGGVAVLVGIPAEPIALDLAARVITRGVTLYGCFGRRIDKTWQTMEELLLSGSLQVSRVITHRFPLVEYQQAFETARSGTSGKVLLMP